MAAATLANEKRRHSDLTSLRHLISRTQHKGISHAGTPKYELHEIEYRLVRRSPRHIGEHT